MIASMTSQSRRRRPTVSILHDGAAPAMAMAESMPVDAQSRLVARRAGRGRQLKGRIFLCLSVFVIVFAVMGARLADITLGGAMSGRVLQAASAPAMERPLITDRNGAALAMNRTVTGVAVDTRNVWDPAETAAGLAQVFPHLSADELAARIRDKRYIVIANEITADDQRRLLALGLPGVLFTEGTRRVYPQGRLAAHVAGYTIPGRGGVAGLEGAADAAGGDIVSSIDVRAQQILEEELTATMTEFQAKSAWGVIMSAATGEVVALASLPDFNPNEVNASPADHWRNRAMQDRYELGSAFKVITAASVIEEGLATPETLYDARRPLKVRNQTISDFHGRHEVMTLSRVIQHSSNIGIARAALDLGTERQQDYLGKLNLLDPLQTELPEAREPGLPARWGPVETATISYGHGIAVTPLQLAAAAAAVVNGGTYHVPTFLKATGPREGKRVFSSKTSGQMRLVMRQVITDGTASKAEAAGYYPIGKTATADKPGVGGYREDARLSSFIGAFPGYDPEYVILVSFDEPKPTAETYGYATAGWNAAPAFSRIVSRLGPAMGLAPVNDDLAFAQFMSGLRPSEEVTLAMREEPDTSAGDGAAQDMDDVARLIAEETGP